MQEADSIFGQLLDVELLSLDDLAEMTDKPVDLEIEESGKTFEQNALLKAKAYALEFGLNTIADDSGLEVAALGGDPGVYSARWVDGTDHDHNLALLKKLDSTQDKKQRRARFVAVICFYQPVEKNAQYFRGIIEGKIALKEKGKAGFGYDPIFIPDGYDRTFAQIGANEKNELSHRRRALDKFAKYLREAQL